MKKNNRDTIILDCTIRDGSYAIDYQFTVEDVYLICLGLVQAGFQFIEIGHGTGLGSSLAGKGSQAASDLEYIKSARLALGDSESKIGTFFIPGIGKIEDIVEAQKNGIGFIRVGTNVNEIEKAQEYIEKAKSLGLIVFSNLMKSYAVSVKEFCMHAQKAEKYGADVVVVVDSAGGMFPEDVSNYIGGLMEHISIDTGFHGHNNLQLAVSNTIAAVKAGATFVDSSLQGMGRSAGNTQTEILVMILEKLGYKTNIDSYQTLNLGERIVKPLMNRGQGIDDSSIISGIAQFHSSFSGIINKAALQYAIDPRRLIMEVSKIDKINVSYDLAERVAKKIKEQKFSVGKKDITILPIREVIKGEESSDSLQQVLTMAQEVLSLSKKTGKESVLSITLSVNGETKFPYIRQSQSFIISNVEVESFVLAEGFIEKLDGKFDWILLDKSSAALRESKIALKIRESKYSWYSEENVLRKSIVSLLSQQRPEGKILLLADEDNFALLNLLLKQQGLEVIGPKANMPPLFFKDIGAVISFGLQWAGNLKEEHATFISDKVRLYAVRPGSFGKSFWEEIINKKNFICRVDMRAALAAELYLAIETKRISDAMGFKLLEDIPIVAGGVIGTKGTVVVDSLIKPSCVIGIADGGGGLVPKQEERKYKGSIEKVRALLFKNIYEKEF